ncbi:DUF4352 domain-containing protein [Actinophytocola sp.]|uniref:DUF4352 domain-containing protein n=1 Tax=Actinophytocola sp. TaxID=1872138 RepID=UPI002ED2339E
MAAFAAGTIGVTRLTASPDAATVADQAIVDSLTAQVTAADWTNMDHDMAKDAPGYKMPPAMMPGMPEDGNQRLAITVTVVNTSEDTRPFRPDEEFTLRAGAEGKARTPRSDTFGDLPRLAPRNAVNGLLFFDLPTEELTESPAWLEWTHGDTTHRLAIPMDGVSAPPNHSHNP